MNNGSRLSDSKWSLSNYWTCSYMQQDARGMHAKGTCMQQAFVRKAKVAKACVQAARRNMLLAPSVRGWA